jgi:hypothetical protein
MDKQLNSGIPLLLQPIKPQAGMLDPVRPGAICPNCSKAKLDYNGLLELECPACGIRFGGGAGCT